MKTALLLATAAFALAASGQAFAQEAGADDWLNVSVSKTRAEVRAELDQARASGSIKAFGVGYMPILSGHASRADVVAALNAARASGQLERIDAEAWAFDGATRGAATRVARASR